MKYMALLLVILLPLAAANAIDSQTMMMPPQIVVNDVTGECGVMARDSYNYYELPEGWAVYEPTNDISGEDYWDWQFKCERNYEECCNNLSYTYVSERIGIAVGKTEYAKNAEFYPILSIIFLISVFAYVGIPLFFKKTKGSFLPFIKNENRKWQIMGVLFGALSSLSMGLLSVGASSPYFWPGFGISEFLAMCFLLLTIPLYLFLSFAIPYGASGFEAFFIFLIPNILYYLGIFYLIRKLFKKVTCK